MKNMTSSLVSQKPEKVYAANDELIEEERWMAEHYGPLPFGTGDRVRFNVSAPEERLLELGLNAKGSMVVLRVVDDRDTLVCATNFPDSDRVSREVFFPDPVTVVVAHEASGKFLIISASYLQMAE